MTSKLKKIIITILIIGGLFLIYAIFIKKPADPTPLIYGTNSLNNRSVAETKLLGNQITQALIQIESLKLERNVLDDKLFKSLVDRSEPIFPEAVGRRNPFAPLSDTSVNYNSGVESLNNNSTSTLKINSTTTIPNNIISTSTQSTTTKSATSSNFLPNTGL